MGLNLVELSGFVVVVLVMVLSFLEVKVDLMVDFISPLAKGFFSEGFVAVVVVFCNLGLAAGFAVAETDLELKELVGGLAAL